MPVEPPFHIYREKLWPLYQGLALWKPNPGDLYERVSIGDVGYVSEGAFIRMFNVRLPWDDESNRKFGIPDRYDPLGFDHFSIRRETFGQVDHYSRCVSRDENANNLQAASPEQADGVAYSCRGRGALLSLPHGGRREDAVQMKIFEKYIRDNVANWFIWAQRNQLGVERMEDLILVSGCTLVNTWAAAVFTDHTMSAEISLTSRTLSNGDATFAWSNVRGPIVHHNSLVDPHSSTTLDQCVFIKGFRAKRVFFRIKPLRAAAEPLPDDPDNRGEGDIHVTPVPGVPNYCDPTIGVLDYIVEKCMEGGIAGDLIAIAHDDDLHSIEDAKTLTADEIGTYLRERNIPLHVEDGAAILRPTAIPTPLHRSTLMSPTYQQQPTLQNARIRTAHDALQVFFAVSRNVLTLLTRRLDADERKAIRPGNVYIWEDRSASTVDNGGIAIERWTDGMSWGPSRIREEFLFYYQKDPAQERLPSGGGKMSFPLHGSGKLIKQTYSVYVFLPEDRGQDITRKWHLTAYFTQGTVDELTPIEDIPNVGGITVPDGLFKSARATKSKRDGPMRSILGTLSSSDSCTAMLGTGVLSTIFPSSVNGPPQIADAYTQDSSSTRNPTDEWMLQQLSAAQSASTEPSKSPMGPGGDAGRMAPDKDFDPS